MSNFLRLTKSIAAAMALTVASSASFASVIFKDGFEGGNLAAKTGGSSWDPAATLPVTSERAKTGSKSVKFHFGPDSNWAELRFQFDKPYQEVWFQMSMYVPANYTHRIGGDGPNNKIFRMWGNDYGNYEKIGYSVWPDDGGMSAIAADWDQHGAGLGPKGNFKSFFTAADLGKWMTVKIYAKAATATTKGTMKIWKNGTLLLTDTAVDNYTASEIHAYQYGYILGNANSGFAATTDFYVDDVVFATTEAELGGTTVVSPPNAPSLQVTPQ